MKKFMLMGLVLFVSMIVYTGCKKDKDEATNTVTTTPTSAIDMLTGGNTRKWKKVSVISNGQPQSLDTCDMDGRVIFTKIGNRFVMDEGTTCHAPDEYGTWALSNNDKSLTLNYEFYLQGSDTIPETDNELIDVITLSNTQLVMRITGSGDTTVITANVAN